MPNHGFRGFQARNHVFYVVWGHFCSRIAPRGPPEDLRWLAGGPRGRQEGPKAASRRGGAALKSLVKYVVLAPGTLQNRGLAAVFSREPRPNRHFWGPGAPKVCKTQVLFDAPWARKWPWRPSPHFRRPRSPRKPRMYFLYRHCTMWCSLACL